MSTDFENSEYFKLISARAETGHNGGASATELLLSHLPITADIKLLEIGCGSGKTLGYLANTIISQPIGIDLSWQALDWAAKNFAASDSSISLNQADVHHLPFADNSFDVVMVESVLIFCQAAVALKEIHRILKPSGYLAMNEMIVLDESIVLDLKSLQQLIHLPYLSPYMDKDWKLTFAEIGFSVKWEAIQPIHRLKVWMLLQMLEIDNLLIYSDALGYGMYVLEKFETS